MTFIYTLFGFMIAAFMAHRAETVEDESTDSPFVPAGRPWTIEDDRRQALTFLADPTLFWLDPNLFGDDPNWRERLFRDVDDVDEAPEPDEPAPMCPSCNNWVAGAFTVTATHDGRASTWECHECGAEFTKAGETRRSKRQRKLRASSDLADRVYADQPKRKWGQKPLPCGCVGTAANVDYVEYGGWAGDSGWSTCKLCGSKWVAHTGAPLVDEGRDGVHLSARKAWALRIERGEKNHGVCPSEHCGFPVDKRDDLFYCTNRTCTHSREGWK